MTRKPLLASLGLLLAAGGSAWGQAPAPAPVSAVSPAPSPLAITPDVAAAYGGVGPATKPATPAATVVTPPGTAVSQDGCTYPSCPGGAVPPGYGYPEFQPPTPTLQVTGVVPAPVAPCEPQVLFGVDYLMWWMKAPPAGFGGNDPNYGPFSGARAHVDWWIGDCVGVEVGAMFFESRARESTTASGAAGSPAVAVPFLDPVLGPSEAFFAIPGVREGSVDIRETLRMYGYEANALFRTGGDEAVQWHALVGLRYLDMRETLTLRGNTTFLDATGTFGGVAAPAGATVNLNDSFSTHNTFQGGQVGLEAEWRQSMTFLLVRGMCAMGDTHQSIVTNGSTGETAPDGSVVVTQGGLFTGAGNIGRSSHDEFSVIPEASVTVGVVLGDHLCLTAGYSFMYWSDVVRPGDQVDHVVNSSLVPLTTTGVTTGPAAPTSSINRTDFWAHGFHAGASLVW